MLHVKKGLDPMKTVVKVRIGNNFISASILKGAEHSKWGKSGGLNMHYDNQQ